MGNQNVLVAQLPSCIDGSEVLIGLECYSIEETTELYITGIKSIKSNTTIYWRFVKFSIIKYI